jgi:hypothetical protein
MTTVLVKHGRKEFLPKEAQDGELLFVDDTSELYVGQGSGKPLVFVGTAPHRPKIYIET